MEFRRVLFRSVFCGSTVMPQTGSTTRPSGVPSSCPPWLPQQPWPPECALCFDSVINRLLPSHNYLRLDTMLESIATLPYHSVKCDRLVQLKGINAPAGQGGPK